MTAPTPPLFQSQLSQPINSNNFLALQSAVLAVSNAGSTGSGHITFTALPGTQRVTFKITNTGTKNAYVAGSNSSSITPAVVSTSTPTPTTGTGAVATCDCIPAGAILTQDFVAGTDTISAICGGSDTTTLELSIGYGQ